VYSSARVRIYRTLQENRFSFIFEIGLALSAAVGLLFITVFFGMKLDLFNVQGSIEQRNSFFTDSATSSTSEANTVQSSTTIAEMEAEQKAKSLEAISEMQLAFKDSEKTARTKVFPGTSFAWADSDEWKTLSSALTKDRDVIRRAAYEAGISPRILVSVVIAEQLRFFTSDRESFKKFFEPLKILGSMSQFSLGISGVKQDTAVAIEKNLKDKTSPYYIGPEYEHLLDVSRGVSESTSATSSNDTALEGTSTIEFLRLTDAKDHYYSYLYTALFVREVIEQWKKAGYDISYRPEIIATLFNLGFDKSIPKPDPQVAGADVTVGGETYTFGRLAYEFYYSGELVEIYGF
jgi:hypothetical protein